MLLQFFINASIVIFMLSLFVVVYFVFCRNYKHFNGIEKEKDKHWANAFFNRFYFVLITFTTIGYGDITPKSDRARLITCIILIILMMSIVKAFDSLITTYHGTFDKYVEIVQKNVK